MITDRCATAKQEAVAAVIVMRQRYKTTLYATACIPRVEKFVEPSYGFTALGNTLYATLGEHPRNKSKKINKMKKSKCIKNTNKE